MTVIERVGGALYLSDTPIKASRCYEKDVAPISSGGTGSRSRLPQSYAVTILDGADDVGVCTTDLVQTRIISSKKVAHRANKYAFA